MPRPEDLPNRRGAQPPLAPLRHRIIWRRFARALADRGVKDLEHGRIRDRWYVSLVHFAGPLADPRKIVEWCDAHAATDFGLAELTTAEIVQFVHTGTSIRVDSLERAETTGRHPAPCVR
jgi:hypothetical protein